MKKNTAFRLETTRQASLFAATKECQQCGRPIVPASRSYLSELVMGLPVRMGPYCDRCLPEIKQAA